MLSFITTDVDIAPEVLDSVLKENVKTSYNQICVDGDTSTNDMVAVYWQTVLQEMTEDHRAREIALRCVQRSSFDGDCTYLAKKLARDGEGSYQADRMSASAVRIRMTCRLK